jgi:hypothetical protein
MSGQQLTMIAPPICWGVTARSIVSGDVQGRDEVIRFHARTLD